jgi:ABC-type nitrate/sulfonate/bicarbonate transport system substrate-binding protein
MRGLKPLAMGIALGLMMIGECGWAADTMKLKLIFSTPYSTNYTPFLVAKDLGYFQKAGLEVEETFVNGDANATRAVITGAGDVALTGPVNVFTAVENGAQIKSIGAWQPIPDYEVVAPPAIKSMRDLADKTFAASGPSGLPQVLPVMLFKKLGIPSDRVKFVSIGGHAARLQTVIAGKADAALVNSITAATGVKNGTVHSVTSVAEHFPKLGYQALAVRTQDLADPAKRKAFEALMEGSMLGARFIMKDPDKAAAIVQARVDSLDPALVKTVIKELTAQKLWGVNGGLDRDITDFTVKLAYDMGEIKTPLKHEQVMDDSINDAVLKKLGKFQGP